MAELIAGAITGYEVHSTSMAAEAALHAKEVAALKSLHEAQLLRSQQQFEEKEQQRRLFHLTSLGVQIDIARRDAIRDAITYKNSTSQILMAVAAVMLGSIFAVIYQFSPPEESAAGWLIVLSILVPLSVMFLLLSVGFGILFHRHITGYYINDVLRVYQPCGKAHATFNDYYHCHCLWSEAWAVRLLFCGLGVTVLAAGVYQYMVMADPTLNEFVTPSGRVVVVDPNPSDNVTAGPDVVGADASPAAEGPGILFLALCVASAVWLILSKWIVVGRTRAGEQDLIGFTDPQTIQRRVAAVKAEDGGPPAAVARDAQPPATS